MKPFSYYDNQAWEKWWDPAHEKNPNHFKNAKVIVFVFDITSKKSYDAMTNFWYKTVYVKIG